MGITTEQNIQEPGGPSGKRAFSPLRLFIGVVFFMSGFAALTYQVIWQRALTQEIGVDSVSVTFIVTIFMIGLGFGALYGGGFARRRAGKLAAWFALIEVCVGLFGIASIPVIRFVNAQLAARVPVNNIFLDFAVNAAVLAPAVFLMGMTTPMVIEMVKTGLSSFGRTVGFFYGLNIAGACAGAVASGLYMIEALGLRKATMFAGLIDLAIGAAFLAASRFAGAERVADKEQEAAANRGKDAGPGFRVALACGMFGFTTLSLEMIFFRQVNFYLTPSVFLFPLMLSVFLLVMSAGNALIGGQIDSIREDKRGGFLGAISIYAIALIMVTMSVSPGSLSLRFLNPDSQIDMSLLLGYMHNYVLLILLVMCPALFTSGLLPAVARMTARDISGAGRNFGRILFYFTCGNILGAFLTGIVLFEYIGLLNSLYLTMGVLVAGVFLMIAPGKPENRKLACVCAVAVAAAVFIIPKDRLPRLCGGDIIEGESSIMCVGAADKDGSRPVSPFRLPGTAFAITDVDKWQKAQSGDFFDKSLSTLMVMDKGFRPKRILVIGMGSGMMPYCLKELDSVERIDVVELDKNVYRSIRRFSDKKIKDLWTNPKIRFYTEDGRRFIQKNKRGGEKYDLIQIVIFNIIRPGSSNVYSAEFFRELKKNLKPGGYMATHQQAGIGRLGGEVFGHVFTTDRGAAKSYLFFSDGLPLPEGDTVYVPARLASYYGARSLEDVKAGIIPASLPDLTVTEIDKDSLKGQRLATDDNLAFEYRYLRGTVDRYQSPYETVDKLDYIKKKTYRYKVTPSPEGRFSY